MRVCVCVFEEWERERGEGEGEGEGAEKFATEYGPKLAEHPAALVTLTL